MSKPRAARPSLSLLAIGLGVTLAALGLAAPTGCFLEEQDPLYCEGFPEDTCPEGITTCTSDEQCTAAGRPVCNSDGGGVCVQCTKTAAAACTGATPLCGDDNTCRACRQHAECASAVCLEDGSCGDEALVAYVAEGGSATAACTRQAPCDTITRALTTTRPFIKISGTIRDRVVIDQRPVTLLGDPKSQLAASGFGSLLTIGGAHRVELRDLELSGASGGATPRDGVGIAVATGAPTVVLHAVRVVNSSGVGISMNRGTLRMSRSTLFNNKGGGLFFSGDRFDLTNNFIIDNGDVSSTGSTFGGVTLENGALDSRFDHNTVAFNHTRPGASDTPGVKCVIPSFTAGGNIVTSNDNVVTNFPAQTQGGCAFTRSFTAPGSKANDLKFADLTQVPPDVHLTATSPASVRDAAACTGMSVDIDGEARPQHGACDLGADEYKDPQAAP